MPVKNQCAFDSKKGSFTIVPKNKAKTNKDRFNNELKLKISDAQNQRKSE